MGWLFQIRKERGLTRSGQPLLHGSWKRQWVTIYTYSSFNDDCDDGDDDDDDDESSIVSKLMLKYKSLLSKKKHYKHELVSLTKEFDSVKNDFAILVKSNEKLVSDLKSSNSLEDQLKKANDEN